MKIFNRFNSETLCQICKKNIQGKSVLIPLDGTEDGNLVECLQVHLNCLDLRIMRTRTSGDVIYQIMKGGSL